MKVDVSTVLNCSAAKAWSEVQKSSLHQQVIRPLARFVPVGAPFPERWSEGLTIQGKLIVFGIVPMGVHTIHFERIDHRSYEIQSREHDPLVARWDHLVSIKPLDEGRSMYRDTIDIDAGILTPLVAAWAHWFYRHRQRRWRALATTLCAIAVAALLSSIGPVEAFDDAMYPDLKGQWLRINLGAGGQISFDPTKPWGLGQQAPLTPEYQAMHEASLADQAKGGQGNWHSGARCMPAGMPATMNGYNSLEFVVLPEVTYVMVEHNLPIHRRIYTDGRDWPQDVEPTFQGYSIGKWIDSDDRGRFDVLEVETRNFKGPRALDPTGIPTHVDNQSIVKERIYLDKARPDVLHNDLTLIDHALTRPWTVSKTYRRNAAKVPEWREENCPSVTRLIKIRDELYFKGADDNLMPTRKDQPPPDLRYFNQTRR